MNSGSRNGFVLWEAPVALVDLDWASSVGSRSSGNRVEDLPGTAGGEPTLAVSYPDGTLGKKSRELTTVFMLLVFLGIYANS
jgi:hypothetical protein